MLDDKDFKDGRDDKFGGKMGARKGTFKKKICKFCQGAAPADYRNPEALKRYTTERGKILPARITGTCSKHQRVLNREIKRARTLAYLPFEKQF